MDGRGRISGEDVDLTSNNFEAAIFGDEAAVMATTTGYVEAFEFGNENDGAERDDGGIDGNGAKRGDGFAQCAAACGKTGWIKALEADFLIRARTNFGAIAVAFGKTNRFTRRQSTTALHADAIVEVARDLGDDTAAGVVDGGVFRPRVFFGEVVVRIAKAFTAAEVQPFARTFEDEFRRFVGVVRRAGRPGARWARGRAIFFRGRSVCPGCPGPTSVFRTFSHIVFVVDPRLTRSGHTRGSGKTAKKRQGQRSHHLRVNAYCGAGPSLRVSRRFARVSGF